MSPSCYKRYIGCSKFHYKKYREAIASKKYLGLRTNFKLVYLRKHNIISDKLDTSADALAIIALE